MSKRKKKKRKALRAKRHAKKKAARRKKPKRAAKSTRRVVRRARRTKKKTKSSKVRKTRKATREKVVRRRAKKKATRRTPRVEVKTESRNGYNKRFRELQDGRRFIEYWSYFKFDPPVSEDFASREVDEWLKIQSKPKAIAYFDEIAPNEFVFAKVYVQCRFFHRNGTSEEAWSSSGIRLALHDLTFETIALVIERLSDSLQGLKPFIMRINIVYSTLPRLHGKAKLKAPRRKAPARKTVRRIRHRGRTRVSR